MPERLALRYARARGKARRSGRVRRRPAGGGRLTFTRDEALLALGISLGALKQAALRLAKRKRLLTPRRGFYVIVPLEHRAVGAPPLDAWLPALLRFHGAAGGPPAEQAGAFVVETDKRLRPVVCGPYRVSFTR